MEKTQKAYLITLEGIEGVGKTTHLGAIKDFLQKRDIECIVTHEPGATLLGKDIRKWLLSPEKKISPEAELALLFADKAEHIKNIIRPALDAGKWVISDRFTDASLAYQGGGRGIPMELIQNLIDYICRDVQPDITFLLDIELGKALHRVSQRNLKDRFESEDQAFFERVQGVYHALARQEPQRWHVINTDADIAITQQSIQQVLEAFIQQRNIHV